MTIIKWNYSDFMLKLDGVMQIFFDIIIGEYGTINVYFLD